MWATRLRACEVNEGAAGGRQVASLVSLSLVGTVSRLKHFSKKMLQTAPEGEKHPNESINVSFTFTGLFRPRIFRASYITLIDSVRLIALLITKTFSVLPVVLTWPDMHLGVYNQCDSHSPREDQQLCYKFNNSQVLAMQ